MKTKKVVLINDTVEYNITIKDVGPNRIHKMKRSNADSWADSSKGEKVAVLINNGNEAAVNIGGNTVVLDYSQLWELHILLTEFHNGPLHDKFTILKSDI
jgi:hypothetical protein